MSYQFAAFLMMYSGSVFRPQHSLPFSVPYIFCVCWW